MSRAQPGRTEPAKQQGRAAPTKKRALLPFYLIFGVIAVIGGIFLIYQLSQTSAPVPASALSIDQVVKPLNAPVGTTPEGFYYKGDPNAPVKVIEYSDFQCPACGNYARSSIAQTITQQYVETGKVQFTYHDFPLQQHRNAVPAAAAPRCAAEQGPPQFWRMHDVLFGRQGEWSTDTNPARRFGTYAQELGLDQDTFDQCLSSGKYTQPVQAAATAAQAAGANATPTFTVDGQIVQLQQGTELQQAIEAALLAKGQ